MTTKPDRVEVLAQHLALSVETALARVEQEMSLTRGTIRLSGAEPRPLVTAAGTGTRATTSASRVLGLMVAETTGTTPAVIRLRDGSDTGGDLVMTVRLTPGQSVRDFYGPQGIAFGAGVYVDVVTGSVEGSVLVGAP